MRENRGKSVPCFLGLSHSVWDGGYRGMGSLGSVKMMLLVII